MLPRARHWFLTTAISAGATLLLGPTALRAELATQERNERLAMISADARDVQQSASRMEMALRVKSPDLSAARVALSDIDASVGGIEAHILALKSASPAWASGSESFHRMEQKLELLKAFVKGKASLLEEPNAMKNRKLLAAKAKGIAHRAALLSGYASVDTD